MPERRSESTSDRMSNRMSEYTSGRISVGGDLGERDVSDMLSEIKQHAQCPLAHLSHDPDHSFFFPKQSVHTDGFLR